MLEGAASTAGSMDCPAGLNQSLSLPSKGKVGYGVCAWDPHLFDADLNLFGLLAWCCPVAVSELKGNSDFYTVDLSNNRCFPWKGQRSNFSLKT